MWATNNVNAVNFTSVPCNKGFTAMRSSDAKDDDEISTFSDLDVLSPIMNSRPARSTFPPVQCPTHAARLNYNGLVAPFMPPSAFRRSTAATVSVPPESTGTTPVWFELASVPSPDLRTPAYARAIQQAVPPPPPPPRDLVTYMERSCQTRAFLEKQMLVCQEMTTTPLSPPCETPVVVHHAATKEHSRAPTKTKRRSSTATKVGLAEKSTIVPALSQPQDKLLTEEDYLQLHKEKVEEDKRRAPSADVSLLAEDYEEPWLTAPSETPTMSEEQYLQLHKLTMQMQRSHSTRANVVVFPTEPAAAAVASPCASKVSTSNPTEEVDAKTGNPPLPPLKAGATTSPGTSAPQLSTPVGAESFSAGMVTQSPAAFSKMDFSSSSRCALQMQRRSMLLLKQQLLSGNCNGNISAHNDATPRSRLFAPDLTVRAAYTAQAKHPTPNTFANGSNLNTVSSFLKQQYPHIHKLERTSKQRRRPSTQQRRRSSLSLVVHSVVKMEQGRR